MQHDPTRSIVSLPDICSSLSCWLLTKLGSFQLHTGLSDSVSRFFPLPRDASIVDMRPLAPTDASSDGCHSPRVKVLDAGTSSRCIAACASSTCNQPAAARADLSLETRPTTKYARVSIQMLLIREGGLGPASLSL